MTAKSNAKNILTPERFASGMTFPQYIAYMATPANLKREGTDGGTRIDRSAQMMA